MKIPLTYAATFATLAAIAAASTGCGAPEGTASADETQAQATSQAITPAISATEFVADFGKPVVVAGTNSFTCALGAVQLFAGPMPTSFLPADGRLLLISENAALFTGLSTTFGGDGRTTFALPNLKAVTPNNLAYGVCVYGAFIGNR
jgi:hypothetical protein